MVKKSYKEVVSTSICGGKSKNKFVTYEIADDVLSDNYILENILLAPSIILSSLSDSVRVINKGGKIVLKMETKPMSEEFFRVLLDRLSEMGSPT